MANIIMDERRTPQIGETCAIKLKNIYPVSLEYDPEHIMSDDEVSFMPNEKYGGISSDDEITFVKYVGNGMFIDLVSDQLLLTVAFNADDFGTDVLHSMDKNSQGEFDKIENLWNSLFLPKNKDEFKDRISTFINNPLALDIADTSFMTINSENAKKFASQSLQELKTKLINEKAKAQLNLKQQYAQYGEKIYNYYSSLDRDSSPRGL